MDADAASAGTQGLRSDDLAAQPTLSLPRAASESEAAAQVAAIRAEEIERSRIFFTTVLVLAVGGIAMAALTDGDPLYKRLLIAASAVSAVAAASIIVVVLNPDRYHPRRVFWGAAPVVLGALMGVCYWGPVSPVVGMLVYGIYFSSHGTDARFVNANYAVLSIVHGGIAALVMFGAIPDRGIVRMGSFAPIEQAMLIVMIEAFYLIAFVMARLSQRAARRSLSNVEEAVRAVAHRDALLAEARDELQRVRAIGGAGKYSGQVVGAYRLGTLIGRGGIGEVYEARHVATESAAAVKLLRADALGDAVQIRRLLREAKAAAEITSPHVVRVFDVGMTASGMPFVVMERMQGYDLAHELRSRRRLTLAAAIPVINDIATGLDAAHRASIVHRDLKPHNVFGAVTDSETRVWKIVDFGVSKLGQSGTLTAGDVVGTPSYMSPEQARAEDVDQRADVYSLAAILFRAVTGHAAFSGRDVATTIYEVVHRVPSQPSTLASLPADVDRVLAIGLAKARGDRFETATELARWFEAASTTGLSAEQRARADEVIGRAPWGSVVKA